MSLLIFVAVLYYAVNIGEVFVRYYRLIDEMRTQARLAAALDDGTIRRRVEAAIDHIGIPDSAARYLVVRRIASPRQIIIETRYNEAVSLPLFNHVFSFNPKATQPL